MGQLARAQAVQADIVQPRQQPKLSLAPIGDDGVAVAGVDCHRGQLRSGDDFQLHAGGEGAGVFPMEPLTVRVMVCRPGWAGV